MTSKLTIVGSSDAFNALGRCHSCYLLEGDGFGPVMIDFGATALSALRRIGRHPTEIRAWLVTHCHGDHIGGFPYLFIDGMFNEVRHDPLEIVGPSRVQAHVEAFVEAAYGDLSQRERPYELRYRELCPGAAAEVAGTTVRAFPASHMDPPEQPLCLRVATPSSVVAFSGDTEMCDGLLEAADGADLLVAECSGLAPPIGRHCTWEDWERILPRCGSRRVVLSHLGRAVRERSEALLQRAPPAVDLRFADDGMIVEIP